MEQFYKNKKILVTGHTGFKGAWLTQILLDFGADVAGVSLKPATNPNLFHALKLDKRVKNHFVDIRNLNALKKVFAKEKPEIVFHLAAQAIVRTSYADPIGTIETNVVGTANVLEAIRDVGCVKSAVMITTDKVYENKEWVHPYRENDHLGGYDPYSGSKAAADIIISSYIRSFFNPKDYKTKHHTLVATARAGNVIGGGDWSDYRIIPDIVKSAYEIRRPLAVRSPKAIRPWEHVLEPLAGYMLLAMGLYKGKKEFSDSWNFGPDSEGFVDVEGLIKEVKIHLPAFKHEIKADNSKHEANILKLDTNKARSLLGWKPRLDFKETVAMTIEWYAHYYDRKDIVSLTDNHIYSFFKKQ